MLSRLVSAGAVLCLLCGCGSARPEPAANTGGAAAAALPVTLPPTTPARPGPTPTPAPTSKKPPAPGPSGAHHASTACPVFPADNIWHADISGLPTRSDSAGLVASIGTGAHLHPDFGAGLIDGAPFGIPVTTVGPETPREPVTFDYADESDPGPYPIPSDAKVEGGPNADGDRHVILRDPTGCRLYELFDAHRLANGSWHAGSGAIFDLRSNRLRPAGWTSADAAGLPIMAGLVRYDEVAAGHVDHAIRVTVPHSRNSYLWPARHAASSSPDPALPPMGLRLRLRAGVDISGLPSQARVIAQAMKTYGLIVADNGSPWFIGGTQDDRWDDDALNALKGFTGADFEAVDVSGLRVSPDSAAVHGG